VIDFGDLCAGDPATDLAGGLLALPRESLEEFFLAYGATDDATIRRTLDGPSTSVSCSFSSENLMNRRTARSDIGQLRTLSPSRADLSDGDDDPQVVVASSRNFLTSRALERTTTRSGPTYSRASCGTTS